jgi:hypothetical protein
MQPKIVEFRQLQTNIAEPQLLQPRTIDPLFSRSIQTICNTDPSPVKPTKEPNPTFAKTRI